MTPLGGKVGARMGAPYKPQLDSSSNLSLNLTKSGDNRPQGPIGGPVRYSPPPHRDLVDPDHTIRRYVYKWFVVEPRR